MALRFLIRVRSTSGRENFLRSMRSLGSSLGLQVRNPKWTSYGALEVDVFPPTDEDFQLFMAALEPLGTIEFHRNLNEAPRHATESELFAEARSLFNSERYWETHEVLEGVWRRMEGEEKSSVQGVILVCAAFVHHQKGEDDVALRVLSRAEKQLPAGRDNFHGLDANTMRESVARILSTKVFRNFTV
ncbi:MAG: DUF309 domain-containing protein [Thaumarchaeota archaeon]|nr:DUF309 domain-containing protein [Nitrososphaerota archaeon]